MSHDVLLPRRGFCAGEPQKSDVRLSVRPVCPVCPVLCSSHFFWTIFGTSKYAKLLGNTQKDDPKRDPKGDKWGQFQEIGDFGTPKMQNC